ncbi:MAG: mobilization protein [Bacteroides sp. 43_108]|nr:MAG: mobilization protein [Bacteroides sp. 43_108]
MAQKASDHIKPCNIGQSEAHNKRTPEYIARINKEKIYLRTELTDKNESWISPSMDGMDLTAYHAALAKLVKEKTGRAMQTKERIRKDKRTGKEVKVSGSSPIRESVVLCKADTTMDELQRYCQACHEQWGITALQIHIHRDEGHYADPSDRDSWTPNLHAHIVWDWMNHETGKSCKLNREDMSRLQNMVAETLGMERGSSKAETGHQHLERNDYIAAKQKREKEAAIAAKEKAEAERDAAIEAKEKSENEHKRIEAEKQVKERRITELDKEIEAKANRANEENGNAILSGLAKIAGRGRYAELEKENEQLKKSVPEQLAKLQKQYSQAVDKAVAEKTAPLEKANRELTKRNSGLEEKCNALSDRLDRLTDKFIAESKWKDTVLDYLAAIFVKVNELFRKAVEAIVQFAQSGFGGKLGGAGHKDLFDKEEAAAIKGAMVGIVGNDGDHKAVGNWLVQVAKKVGELAEEEIYRTQKEVDDVASGKYDWRIDNIVKENGLNR